MYPYLDCPHPDHSGITLEYFEGVDSMPYLEQGDRVSLHQHDFYEMVLILRGTCQHNYQGSSIHLIPGDLFLIPPHQPHSYHFQKNIAICNCQFYSHVLKSAPEKFIRDLDYVTLQQKASARKRLQDLQAFEAEYAELATKYTGDINSQGIIHLSRAERDSIFAELSSILKEQKEQKYGFELVKQRKLEQVLIQIKRVQMDQFASFERADNWKEEMVDAVLNMIESNITQDFDFNELAKKQNITPSYFRSIFKTATGLSPVEYLNRARILRALELLQTTSYSIAEISEKVGIYDANYFSRLFKKIIGYPPRYFKSITEE